MVGKSTLQARPARLAFFLSVHSLLQRTSEVGEVFNSQAENKTNISTHLLHKLSQTSKKFNRFLDKLDNFSQKNFNFVFSDPPR